jgi:hypothetical protein
MEKVTEEALVAAIGDFKKRFFQENKGAKAA